MVGLFLCLQYTNTKSRKYKYASDENSFGKT